VVSREPPKLPRVGSIPTALANFRCFCGKPSVEIDTWFHWYPCEDHKHLTPNEYKDNAVVAQK
jgi:hypothetical protein